MDIKYIDDFIKLKCSPDILSLNLVKSKTKKEIVPIPAELSIENTLEQIIQALQDDSLQSVYFYHKYQRFDLTVINRNINNSECILTINGLVNGQHRLIPQIMEYSVCNLENQTMAKAKCIQRAPEWKIKLEEPYDVKILNISSNSDFSVHFINPHLEVNGSIVHELINEIKKLGNNGR